MAFPKRICAICSEEFELSPDKPGFANHCPDCTEEEAAKQLAKQGKDSEDRSSNKELNDARRQAMRDLLYRKDS